MAGEFLVMAATLIHIKSRMLLPRPEPAQDDDGLEEDPREALVRRLLEHQKYKAAAELLHERETLRSAQCMRPDARVAEVAGDDYEPELEVDLFSLLRRVQGRARAREPAAAVVLPPEQMSIEDRIEQLLGAAVGDRSVRLRGSVRRRRRLAAVHDRHVPGAARDDPPEADSRVPVGRRRARSASTSARGRRTRRIRLTIPMHDGGSAVTARLGRRPGLAMCRPGGDERCRTKH